MGKNKKLRLMASQWDYLRRLAQQREYGFKADYEIQWCLVREWWDIEAASLTESDLDALLREMGLDT